MDQDDYRRLVYERATQLGLDPNLAFAVTGVESNWDASAVSPKGAGGLMQIMPGTAEYLGYSAEDRFDPVKNVDMGLRYLQEQLNDFGGNVPLALAAYNAGPGAVRKHSGVPPYQETQNYVSKIMGQLEGNGSAPATGGQPVNNSMDRSLPPEMHMLMSGAGLDLSPVQAQEQPDFGTRLATNPLFNLGIGLLSGDNLSSGLSAGMKQMQAAAKMKQQYEQNQIANETTRRQQQLNRMAYLQNYGRMMGYEQPSVAEQHSINMDLQRQRNREEDIDRGRYSEPTTVGTPDGQNLMRVVFDNEEKRYKQITEEGVGEPVDIRDTVNFGQVRTIQKGAGGGEDAGKGGMDFLVDESIADFEKLATEIETNPDMLNAFGTIGELGEKFWGRTKAIRDITGVDFSEYTEKVFGKDPTRVRKRIERVTLPVIRMLVEPSGPISNVERGAGKEMLGLARDLEKRAQAGFFGDKPMGKEEAYGLFQDTMELLTRVRNSQKSGGGESNGWSPGGTYSDPDKEKRYQEWKRQQGR